MLIEFKNKATECTRLTILPSRVKLGDIILWQGELCEVKTIQRDCPRIENLNARFTMMILETRDGRIILADNVVGRHSIYRRKRAS